MRWPASVTIAICSYFRHSLADTLESLRLNLPGQPVSEIIVCDNADTPYSRDMTARFAATCKVPVRYLHAPAHNISLARNACLSACRSRYIAFLDDDEIAEDGWLSALLQEMTEGTTAVCGPVKAIYPTARPRSWYGADLHSVAPAKVNCTLPFGYSGNVLIDLYHPAARGLRFDLSYGVTGGEDTEYFYRITQASGVLRYAVNAQASSKVPPARLTTRWLIERQFRSGQNTARIFRAHCTRSAFLRICVRQMIKVPIGLLMIPYLALVRKKTIIPWVQRIVFAAGFFLSMIGLDPRAAYGHFSKSGSRQKASA